MSELHTEHLKSFILNAPHPQKQEVTSSFILYNKFFDKKYLKIQDI